MKKTLFAIALVWAPVIAISAPKITFMGEVTDQTCEATVNGETEGIVLLPSVPASRLASKGATSGLTPFTLSIKNCSAKPTTTQVTTRFLGHNVTTEGNLGNLAMVNAATNVQLQLLDKATSGNQIKLIGLTPVSGMTLPSNASTASYDYGVQYTTEQGGATPGAVQSIAEYQLTYN